MRRAVAAGHCTLDHLGTVDPYPGPDEKALLQTLSVQGGGPAATAAATLARLGVPTAFVGRTSDDAFGRAARQSLVDAGVDVTGLEVVPGRTSPVSFIAVEARTGCRTVFWSRGDLPPLIAEAVDPAVLDGAGVLVVDGHQLEAQGRLAELARTRGLEVLLDAGSLRPGMEALARRCTAVVGSEAFAAALAPSPEGAVDVLRGWGVPVAGVTLGPRGAVAEDDAGRVWMGALPVEVVDTTGAGDVWHGAFAYALLQPRWDLAARLAFAAAAAGLSCRGLGGRDPLPTLAEVRAALAGWPAERRSPILAPP